VTGAEISSACLESSEVLCPVCGSVSTDGADIQGWGAWRRCTSCTLEFAHPLQLGHDPTVLFNDAYQGRVTTSGMDDFQRRVHQRHVIIDRLDQPNLWFWTPAFEQVLAWLKREIPPGSTVLEVGCGLGFFLHAMRKEGFNAVGLDVAQTVVDLNRKDGFQVWHGPVSSMPSDWVKPQAVVSFFMLHHLDDPMGFLCDIRDRAPEAHVAIAVYGPTNKGTTASLPPRTLLRWNAQALQTALKLTGYEATADDIPSSGVERGALQPFRKLLIPTMRLPWAYRLGKRAEEIVLRRLPRTLKHDAYVVLALARPR
jgi:SAM-dependent methyltransferase